MAESKTEYKKIQIGAQTFDFAVRLDNRSDDKGPYLALDPKTTDLGTVNRFIAAAGQSPLVGLFVKAVNKCIGNATKEAFSESKNAEGQPVWTLDTSVAAKAVVDAIGDSVTAAKDALEAKIAEARKAYDTFFEASIMPIMAKGQCPAGQDVNKLAQLRLAVVQLERKLVKKARKPKVEVAAAPAKQTLGPAQPAV